MPHRDSDPLDGPSLCGTRRHLDERVPPVLPGYRLCGTCLDGVEDALLDLPRWYTRCEQVLADDGQYRPVQRIRRTPEPGIRLCEEAVAVRSQIIETLSGWCAQVVAGRGVRAPQPPSVKPLTRFLGVHLQWLVACPRACAFADDFVDLGAAVEGLLRPGPNGPAPLGVCPWPGCEELLYPVADPAVAASRQIGCAAGHRWPPDQWLALSRELTRGTTPDDPAADPGEDPR